MPPRGGESPGIFPHKEDMGNKTTTKKTTVTKRAAAKPAAKIELTDGSTPPATVTKPRRARATKAAAAKPAAPKKPRVPRARKLPAAIAPFFTADDIALRAYFLGEQRQRGGLPGTPEGDWLEAERQLKAEAVA